AIEHTPPDAGCHGRSRNLNHLGANWFDNDGVRTPVHILDRCNELLRLIDGIIVGVKNLELDAHTSGDSGSRFGLFGLEIVVSGNESQNHVQTILGGEPPCRGALAFALGLIAALRRTELYPTHRVLYIVILRRKGWGGRELPVVTQCSE